MKAAARCAIAGLASGLLVLGAGGRVLMRGLALSTSEAPRFTWPGTLQIVVFGAAWGLLTGPLILFVRARVDGRLRPGAVFGLAVFALAVAVFLVINGFGEIVAPTAFLWLSAIGFPALFVLHGMTVDRWSRKSRSLLR